MYFARFPSCSSPARKDASTLREITLYVTDAPPQKQAKLRRHALRRCLLPNDGPRALVMRGVRAISEAVSVRGLDHAPLRPRGSRLPVFSSSSTGCRNASERGQMMPLLHSAGVAARK